MLVLVAVSASLALAQASDFQSSMQISQLLPDVPRRLLDGSVFVPKPSQRQFNVRTMLVPGVTDGSGINLPREAVFQGGDGQVWVWLHGRPEHFLRRRVRIAPNNTEHVLVLEGLKPGERVVVSGADKIDRVYD